MPHLTNSASANSKSRATKKNILRRWWRVLRSSITIFILVVALGTWGFARHSALHREGLTFMDCLYRSLQLFVLQSGAVSLPVPWQLELARILAPILGFYTALKIFYEKFKFLRLKFYHGHTVICGLGRIGWVLTKRLREDSKKVVIIEKDGENDLINPARELGAIVLIGDATTEEMLKKANVFNARYLIAVGGNDDTNMRTAINAAQLFKDYPDKSLNCLIHISDPLFCKLLSWWWWTGGKDEHSNCHLEFFDIFRSGARALLQRHPPFETELRRAPHILIIGTGRFAQALVERMARDWRKICLCRAKNSKLKVSLVGKDAETIIKQLRIRSPLLKQWCELTPYDYEIPSADFEQGDFLTADKSRDLTQIVVCLENSPQSFSMALLLHQLIIRLLGGKIIPIVAVVDYETDVTAQERESINTFGIMDKTCDPNLLLNGNVLTIAKAMHEEHIRWGTSKGYKLEDKPSMGVWEELTPDFKDSFIRSARYLNNRLQAIGCQLLPLANLDAESFKFTRDEIEQMAKREHTQWREERSRKGWKCGKKDDERNRLSLWLTKWDDLPEDGKEYFLGLTRRLPVVLERVDFEVCRVHYELLAQELHKEYQLTGMLVGERPPEQCRRFDWGQLGEPLQKWYRDKAARIVAELWSLGYKAAAVDEGEARVCKLPQEVLDEFCAMENNNWDSMSIDKKEAQRNAAKRLLKIMAELHIQVYQDQTEVIARAFHEQWLEDQKKAGQTPETNPFMVPWDKLPEYKKESNRKEAEHIPTKLNAIGCGIRPRPDPKAPLFQFTDEEIEKMAEMEHRRWFDEITDNGWSYGPVKDVKKKTNPNLVEWRDLPDEVKGWNRNSVEKIPEILALVGLEVYRVNP